jgi:hypothetical protein
MKLTAIVIVCIFACACPFTEPVRALTRPVTPGTKSDPPLQHCAPYLETEEDQDRKKKHWQALIRLDWNAAVTPDQTPQYLDGNHQIDEKDYVLGVAFGPLAGGEILMLQYADPMGKVAKKAQLKFVWRLLRRPAVVYWLEARDERCRVYPGDIAFRNEEIVGVDIYERVRGRTPHQGSGPSVEMRGLSRQEM